jgi:hypothetical protein
VDVTEKLIVVERMFAQAPEIASMVTQAGRELTGGAESHYTTNQLFGMRKGSMLVRGVAAKGSYAVLVVGGSVVRQRH